MDSLQTRLASRIACVAFASAVTAASMPAPAACRPPFGDDARAGSPQQIAYENCRWDHRVGLEATVQAGFGMALGPAPEAFQLPERMPDGTYLGPETRGHRLGPGFDLGVSLGWRIVPAFSIGAHLTWQYSPATDLAFNGHTFNTTTSMPSVVGTTTTSVDFYPTSGRTDLWTAGIYTRLYIGSALGIRRIDPWVGIGFDFPADAWVATNVNTKSTATTSFMNMNIGSTMTSGNNTITLTVAAVNIPITVGFDVNVTPEFSIGALAQVSLLVPYGRCANATSVMTSACDWTWSADGRPAQQFDTVVVFNTGLQGRFLAPW